MKIPIEPHELETMYARLSNLKKQISQHPYLRADDRLKMLGILNPIRERLHSLLQTSIVLGAHE